MKKLTILAMFIALVSSFSLQANETVTNTMHVWKDGVSEDYVVATDIDSITFSQEIINTMHVWKDGVAVSYLVEADLDSITFSQEIIQDDETEGANDHVLNTFELGGFALFNIGKPIAGTDTVLKTSVGEVTCQLAPALYYVWDKGITLAGNDLAGAGFIMPVKNYTYVITDSPNGAYNGYYISSFDIVVDTLASAEEALAYSSKNGVYAAPYGQLLDVNMYGDAWDAILNFSEESTEDEINAAYDLYYASQTGTPFYHLDLNTSSQSYNYGNVSYLYLTEDRETGELYYDLKLEWYDHVNKGRWYGLKAKTELDWEGNEVLAGIAKPYDMRLIHKEYLKLPPVEEKAGAPAKAQRQAKPAQYTISNQILSLDGIPQLPSLKKIK